MITFEEAKRLSDIKWEYFYNNGWDILDMLFHHTELKYLRAHCGFCEKYFIVDCRGCPMKVKGGNCNSDKHPYSKWWYNKTKKNALAVLKLVRKAKEI